MIEVVSERGYPETRVVDRYIVMAIRAADDALPEPGGHASTH